MKTIVFVGVLVMFSLSMMAYADVPSLMNFQGTLTDTNGVALDTTVSMTFSIYTDSTGGTQIWSETQPVVVSRGIFNVLLGSVNAISDTVFSGPQRWLGVQVEADPELAPRRRILSVGYAFRAAEADTADYARITVGDGDWTIAGNNMYSAVSGNVGIGLTSPTAKLQIEGALRFGSATAKYQIQEVTRDISDFIDFGGLGIRSNDGFNRQMMLFTDGQASDNIFTVTVSADQGSTWTANFVIQQNGDIGIGTPTPLEKLQVEGVVYSTTGGFKFPVGTVQATAFSASSLDSVGYADSSGYADVAGFAPMPDSVAYADLAGTDSDWAISGSDMYSAVSGNVGIGLMGPQAKLHLQGAMRFGAAVEQFQIQEVSNLGSEFIDYGGILIGSNNGFNRQMIMFTDGQGSNNIFTVAASADQGSTWTANFVVQQNGDIGIGTPVPVEKLQVEGIVRSTTGGFKFPDGTVQTTAFFPSSLDSVGYADSSGYADVAGSAPMPDSVTHAVYADTADYAAVAPMADSVTHAVYSDTADYAVLADTARVAGYADVAGSAPMPDSVTHAVYADTADYAAVAPMADSVTHAVYSDTADYAVLADTARVAGYADVAGSAPMPDSVTHAVYADTATYAITATHYDTLQIVTYIDSVTYADSAVYAEYADTADYAAVAPMPDSVLYADSSGYAAVAGSAPMPDSVTHAVYADTADYAPVAPMPDSVLYADSSAYADVAGFAPMPDSVTHAVYSDTAAYTITASHIDSVTYADTSAYANYADTAGYVSVMYRGSFQLSFDDLAAKQWGNGYQEIYSPIDTIQIDRVRVACRLGGGTGGKWRFLLRHSDLGGIADSDTLSGVSYQWIEWEETSLTNATVTPQYGVVFNIFDGELGGAKLTSGHLLVDFHYVNP